MATSNASTSNKMKQMSRNGVHEAEKTLDKVNKVAAEMVGERMDKVARSTQGQATDFISSLRQAVAAGSRQLKKDGYHAVGNMVDHAAGQTDRVEKKVDRFDTEEFSASVQQFIREKPLVAFGGLALVGFLAAAAMQKAQADLDK